MRYMEEKAVTPEYSLVGTCKSKRVLSHVHAALRRLCRGYAILAVTCMVTMTLPRIFGGVVFTNLYSFDGTNGNLPLSTLVQAPNGSFYGTTRSGGAFNCGTIFQISTNGTFTSFPFDGTNGSVPYAGVTLGSDGNFYGTTRQGGGSGNVFIMTPDGVISNLYAFKGGGAEGNLPQDALIEGTNGEFYGTTTSGGILSAGTLFKITTNGVLTTLLQFGGTNTGSAPLASLVMVKDGSLYGTTSQGNQGTVFRINTDGSGFTNLASFKATNVPNNGIILKSQLLEGTDGRLYGTASAGGTAQGYGTIFAVTTNGAVTAMTRFGGTNGSFPYGGLILASDGNFYGTTYQGGSSGWNGPGTIFQMSPKGLITNLVSFTGTSGSFAGSNPQASLVQGSDGNFYGTTSGGGSFNGGTVFRLSVPLMPRVQFAVPTNGSVALTWNSVAGLSYQLQYSSDLSGTVWSNVGDSIIANGGQMSSTIDMGEASQGFYRVVLLQ